ncbi:MAG: metallophosphoesterase [Clostridia bacterium]|nr:metallophosphoesterase [Clostridia bacterium]
MGIWIAVLAFALLLTAGALFYLLTRFRRLSFVARLGGKNRFLPWLAAVLLLAPVAAFALIGLPALVVVLLHLAVFFALSDLIALLVRRTAKHELSRDLRALLAVCLCAIYLGVGWVQAHQVALTGYTVADGKLQEGERLRVVLIADAHLGITLDGAAFAREMERVGETEPDLVVLVGDFVDDESKKEDLLAACRALGGLHPSRGVYFVYGNHDNGYYSSRDFSAADLRAALTENGVRILEDEAIFLDGGFVLIGRRDRSSRDRASVETLTAGLDPGLFSILLDHQPNDYENEAGAVDLVLSGHTHGGHIFPAGWIGELIGANDFTYGREDRQGTTFIVTSGISGWAIPFKTGTRSEFAVIDVVPA